MAKKYDRDEIMDKATALISMMLYDDTDGAAMSIARMNPAETEKALIGVLSLMSGLVDATARIMEVSTESLWTGLCQARLEQMVKEWDEDGDA